MAFVSSKTYRWYKDIVMRNRDDYPNLYSLEVKKNKWRFLRQNIRETTGRT